MATMDICDLKKNLASGNTLMLTKNNGRRVENSALFNAMRL